MEKKEQGMTTFEKLSAINVNDKTEKKGKYTYLTWSFAWSELKKVSPNAYAKVYHDENTNMPYFLSKAGALVKVGVTVDELEHINYLPVMDMRNNAIAPEKINMMDVNKAIQRCTVKAIALHGLGLYIYAGEDLPESETEQAESKVNAKAKAVAVAKTEKKTPKHITLDIGDGNWVTVLNYIARNKSKGLKTIVNTLSTKYAISPTVIKSIKGFVDLKDTPNE